MLKAGKRTFDDLNAFPRMSPTQCSPARQFRFVKRSRSMQVEEGGDVSMATDSERPPSSFVPSQLFQADEVSNFCRKKKQRPAEEKTYTLEEVKQIVARVVADREDKLRAEYDTILQQKLAEQYQNFAKFNQDYISRQLKASSFDYMS